MSIIWKSEWGWSYISHVYNERALLDRREGDGIHSSCSSNSGVEPSCQKQVGGSGIRTRDPHSWSGLLSENSATALHPGSLCNVIIARSQAAIPYKITIQLFKRDQNSLTHVGRALCRLHSRYEAKIFLKWIFPGIHRLPSERETEREWLLAWRIDNLDSACSFLFWRALSLPEFAREHTIRGARTRPLAMSQWMSKLNTVYI